MLPNTDTKIKKFDKLCLSIILLSLGIYIYIYFQMTLSTMITKKELAVTGDNSSLTIARTFFALCITIVSIVFRIKHHHRLTTLGRVFLVLSIYMLIFALLDPVNVTIKNYITSYTTMSLWIFVYFFFYTFGKTYSITSKQYAFFISSFTIYFFSLFLHNYLILTFGFGTPTALIESYFCIMMLPFITYLKGGKKIILISLIIIAAILSAKRTGTLALCVALIIYLWMSGHSLTGKIKSIFLILITFISVYLLANYFFEEQFIHIIERFMNIKEDGGSGRDALFVDVFNRITESSPVELIFGHGYNSVINYFPYSAHNDFLEVAFDYGLIGLLIYLSAYIAIIKSIIKNNRYRTTKRALSVSAILFFLVSCTSILILYPTSIIVLCAFWGIAESRCMYKSNLKKSTLYENHSTNLRIGTRRR